MFKEILHLRHLQHMQLRGGLLPGGGEFAVACGDLPDAFQVSVQHIRCLDVAEQSGILGAGRAGVRLQERRVDCAQLRRDHGRQPVGGHLLHLAEAGQQTRVVMLHRRGDVAGEDLAGLSG